MHDLKQQRADIHRTLSQSRNTYAEALRQKIEMDDHRHRDDATDGPPAWAVFAAIIFVALSFAALYEMQRLSEQKPATQPATTIVAPADFRVR